jgi:hypothetical protein
LLIYCSRGLYCHHSAVINADRWPDDAVLLDMDGRAVCTKCVRARRERPSRRAADKRDELAR